VELRGFEPLTPTLPVWCATSCATAPLCGSSYPTSPGPPQPGPFFPPGGSRARPTFVVVDAQVVPLVEPDAEGVDPQQRRELQQRRLGRLVERLFAAGGLQAGRLRDAGVHSGSEVTLDGLSQLPTVTKRDLWDHYPGGLRAVPAEDVVCVHGSSGTGGRPTLVPYTASDVDVWAQVMARALGGAGATRRSLVHNAYGYGLFTGGLGVHHGAMRLGATVLPLSGGMTERQVRMISDLKPDILTCTPSYAIFLGEVLGAPPPSTTGLDH
jgi:phenylacetate-CoA ligase